MGNQNVELAINFELVKTYKKSELKFIQAIDNYRSYDLITLFNELYEKFKNDMVLSIHFKFFQTDRNH